MRCLMNIVIAPDSFKGSCSSLSAAALIKEGVRRVFPDAEITMVPVADGGEGTVEAVLTATGGDWVETPVKDPLGRDITARWGAADAFAVIEMAEASGVKLLTKKEQNPLETSSYGTGQLLIEALNKGYRKILIGLGDSATNDGGAGMARALGVRFLDQDGFELADGGGDLYRLAAIDLQNLDPRIIETEITVASDVTNPLLGTKGATAAFSRTKGATNSMQEQLESGLMKLAEITKQKMGDCFCEIPGAGAAGGMGFGLMAFCGASLSSGIDTVLNYLEFDRLISHADLVISGEGTIDYKSEGRKVLQGIARRCSEKNTPLLAITGNILVPLDRLYKEGVHGVICTVPKIMTLDEAIKNSDEHLKDGAERALRMIRLGMEME